LTGKGVNDKPEYYKLLTHPFFVRVLENQRSLTSSLSKQAIQALQLGESPGLDITPEIVYHNGVFHYASNLIGAVSRMEEVPIYLRRFPNSKFFNEHSITLHKWVNYHYSHYLVVVVNLYDIALLLTNAVFALGINPRYCDKKGVAKNKLVRKTKVKGALDRLKAAIGDYRETRHLYVHRGHVPGLDFLDQLDSLRFVQESMEELEIERQSSDVFDPLMNPRIVRDLYRLERRQLITQIMQTTRSFVEILIEFLDTLFPVYQHLSEYWSKMPPNPA